MSIIPPASEKNLFFFANSKILSVIFSHLHISFLSDINGSAFSLKVGFGKILAKNACTEKLNTAYEQQYTYCRGPAVSAFVPDKLAHCNKYNSRNSHNKQQHTDK